MLVDVRGAAESLLNETRISPCTAQMLLRPRHAAKAVTSGACTDAATRGPKSDDPAQEKGHFSVPFSVIAPGETRGSNGLHVHCYAGCLCLPEGYECQSKKAGAEEEQA